MAYVFILLVACLITGCSEPEDKKDPRFVPQLNPHPKYFITVEGDIDPGIAEDLTLSWHIAYATHNDACNKVVNYFEGAEVARFTEETVTFLANAGHYRYQFAIDKYLPGYCQWEAVSIYYKFSSHKQGQIKGQADFDFGNPSKSYPYVYQDSWLCHDIKCDLVKQVVLHAYFARNHSYVYKLHLIKEML